MYNSAFLSFSCSLLSHEMAFIISISKVIKKNQMATRENCHAAPSSNPKILTEQNSTQQLMGFWRIDFTEPDLYLELNKNMLMIFVLKILLLSKLKHSKSQKKKHQFQSISCNEADVLH